MRTTVEIPEELLTAAMTASGSRTKKEALHWALRTALRRKAIEDVLALEGKIQFGMTAEEMEERERRAEKKEARWRARRRRPAEAAGETTRTRRRTGGGQLGTGPRQDTG